MANKKGVVTVWLTLTLLTFICGFLICMKAIYKIYETNENMRRMSEFSRLSLSYYDYELFRQYGLLALPLEGDALNDLAVREGLAFEKLELSENFACLATPQAQMIKRGYLLSAKGLMVNQTPSKASNQTRQEPKDEAFDGDFNHARAGETPTHNQWVLWERLKQWRQGGETAVASNNTQAIASKVYDSRTRFDGQTVKAMNLLDKMAWTSWAWYELSSRFHETDDKRQLPSGEIEYLIGGSPSGRTNDLLIKTRFVVMRTPENILAIEMNQGRNMAVSELAAGISAAFPVGYPLARFLLVGLWSSIEVSEELSRLYEGNLVPIVKTANGPWYTTVNALFSTGPSETHPSKGKLKTAQIGFMNYDNWLETQLLTISDRDLILRSMTLIDCNFRGEGLVKNWANYNTLLHIENKGISMSKGYLDKEATTNEK